MSKKEKALQTKCSLGKRGVIDVSKLLEDGVIVNIQIGRWRAEERIQPRDLGLENLDEQQLKKYMRLGSKNLIPHTLQNRLRVIEGGARSAIIRFSLDTPFGRYVTPAAFPKLREELKQYEEEWFKMRDELCDHMETHQEELRAGYKELAAEVYEQIKAQDMQKLMYAREYANRIIKAIPSVEKIRESFRFDFQVQKVAIPTVLSKAVREQILREEKMAAKVNRIRTHEQEKQRMELEILEDWERNKEEKIDKFVNSVNEQIRMMISQVASAAKTSLDKNHRLLGKTGAQLKKMITQFRMMNILNDKEIEKHVDEIEELMADKEKGKPRAIKLSHALARMHAEARKLSLDMVMPEELRTVRGDLFGSHVVHDKETHVHIPEQRRLAASVGEED